MIHVLLAYLPQELCETLEEALNAEGNIDARSYMTDSMPVLLAATRNGVDVVVLGLRNGSMPGIVSHLLSERPGLHIVAVAPATDSMFLYRFQPELIPLGRLSPERLVDAVRTIVDTDLI